MSERRLAGRATPASPIGGELDLAFVAAAVAMRGDVLDPVAKVAEHPVANSISGGSAARCSASWVLKTCSPAQAASPKDFSPTMRELPLSVWKARRSGRQQLEVAGRRLQLRARCRAPFDHLARFLEEDLAHLVVVLEVADQGDRLHRRRAAPAR